jgi:hypothetical protein
MTTIYLRAKTGTLASELKRLLFHMSQPHRAPSCLTWACARVSLTRAQTYTHATSRRRKVTQQAAGSRQHAARSTQQAASGKQQAASSTQQAASSTQHATCSTQHAARSTQQAASSKQQAARSTQHAASSSKQHEASSKQQHYQGFRLPHRYCTKDEPVPK